MAFRFVGPDFDVEDVTIATRGAIPPSEAFELGQGAPRNAVDEVMRDRFGTDLYLSEDLEVLASGELRLVSGEEAWRARFVRALATEPGELWWRPEYGIGVGSFLNRSASRENIEELQSRIRQTLESDPAVEEVSVLEVRQSFAGLLEVEVRVVLAGVPVDALIRSGRR